MRCLVFGERRKRNISARYWEARSQNRTITHPRRNAPKRVAGVLLLVNEPFRLGDLISVTGIEGNVDDIQARATVVTTKEGRQVVIPNAVLFTNPVAVAHNGTTHQ